MPKINQQITGSEDLQKQIELLKYYPEIFDRHFYPAMKDAAELIKGGVRPHVPVHTGRLLGALGSKVIHSGTAALGTSAHIGFGKRYSQPSAPYAAPIEAGARPHEVSGRRTADGKLHFSSRGRFTTIQSIHHPGFAGRHMLETGLEQAMPAVNARMAVASDQVVKELVVK
jgi:hypothetical protein